MNRQHILIQYYFCSCGVRAVVSVCYHPELLADDVPILVDITRSIDDSYGW